MSESVARGHLPKATQHVQMSESVARSHLPKNKQIAIARLIYHLITHHLYMYLVDSRCVHTVAKVVLSRLDNC